jgi:enediyne polyketide synthase
MAEVVLRSDQTAFAVDHFRAICRFSEDEQPTGDRDAPTCSEPEESISPSEAGPLLTLDPERDLYGQILFHTGRFRRVRGYRRLTATECLAEIAPDTGAAPGSHGGGWYARYLPQQLALGDPGARDAAIHSIQACIPHARLLPIGVDRIVTEGLSIRGGSLFASAKERQHDGDTYIYDLDIMGEDGRVVERWRGLTLRRVETIEKRSEWAEGLLAPYIERRLQELLPRVNARVVLDRRANLARRHRSDRAIAQALRKHADMAGAAGAAGAVVTRRPDGKPSVSGRGDLSVSTAHARDLTLAVAGQGSLGCDLEEVQARSASVWNDLLGAERFKLAQLVARQSVTSPVISGAPGVPGVPGVPDAPEVDHMAATRVWSAVECLKKAGAPPNAPLVLSSVTDDNWVLLRSGRAVIATVATRIVGFENELVVAVAVSEEV